MKRVTTPAVPVGVIFVFVEIDEIVISARHHEVVFDAAAVGQCRSVDGCQ